MAKRRKNVGIDKFSESFVRFPRDVDLASILLPAFSRFEVEACSQAFDQSPYVVPCEAMRVQENTLRLVRFDRSIVHEPVRKIACGQESMDVLRNALSTLIVELMSVEPKRCVADRLKPDVVVRGVQFLLGWSENPLLEQIVQVIDVLVLACTVLQFQSVRSAAVLRFEMRVSEEQSDQHIALEVGQLQRRFPLFDLS